jgi:predicted Fe-Mo cluster-binding NifX family protein
MACSNPESPAYFAVVPSFFFNRFLACCVQNSFCMKRKVAIPLFGTRISPHFTYADMALLIDIENGEVAQSHEIALGQTDELQRIQYLKSLEIDTLICGGISNIAERMLAEQAVNVISWVTGEARDALEQFLCKRLAPGTWLCPKRNRCRTGQGKGKKTPPCS